MRPPISTQRTNRTKIRRTSGLLCGSSVCARSSFHRASAQFIATRLQFCELKREDKLASFKSTRRYEKLIVTVTATVCPALTVIGCGSPLSPSKALDVKMNPPLAPNPKLMGLKPPI